MPLRFKLFVGYTGVFIVAVILGAARVVSDAWMLWMLLPYLALVGYNLMPTIGMMITNGGGMCARGESEAARRQREHEKAQAVAKAKLETKPAGLSTDPRAEAVESEDGSA